MPQPCPIRPDDSTNEPVEVVLITKTNYTLGLSAKTAVTIMGNGASAVVRYIAAPTWEVHDISDFPKGLEL